MRKCACDNCEEQMGCYLEMPCMKYFDYYYDGEDSGEDEDDDEFYNDYDDLEMI